MFSMLAWSITALDLLSDTHVGHLAHRRYFGYLCLLYIVSVVAIPLSVWRLEKQGPDTAVFALQTWGIWGMFCLDLPILLCYLQGYDEAQSDRLVDFFNQSVLATMDAELCAESEGFPIRISVETHLRATCLADRTAAEEMKQELKDAGVPSMLNQKLCVSLEDLDAGGFKHVVARQVKVPGPKLIIAVSGVTPENLSRGCCMARSKPVRPIALPSLHVIGDTDEDRRNSEELAQEWYNISFAASQSEQSDGRILRHPHGHRFPLDCRPLAEALRELLPKGAKELERAAVGGC
ncbi:unnamed protein product [Effrenium voratum]|nr:unnamed protein product [Effrenium voratum]